MADKRKFLFVSIDALISDIAWLVSKEGCNVRYYIESESERTIGDGFVPKVDEWEYWVLGHPPIAMYMRTVSPTRTLVEVNPFIPGWRREYVEGVGTSWAVFGGLFGVDAMPDGTHKLRLFWGLL